MSTRSGRRRNHSVNEVLPEREEPNYIAYTSRKTRNKLNKEIDVVNGGGYKTNYVSYPLDHSSNGKSDSEVTQSDDCPKTTRSKARKNPPILKDVNVSVEKQPKDMEVDVKPVEIKVFKSKHTRKKKISSIDKCDADPQETVDQLVVNENIKPRKKTSKKRSNRKRKPRPENNSCTDSDDNKSVSFKNHDDVNARQELVPDNSDCKKTKPLLTPLSETVEQVINVPVKAKNSFNSSAISSESFHSAAESPPKPNIFKSPVEIIPATLDTTFDKPSNSSSAALAHASDSKESVMNTTFDKSPDTQRRSSRTSIKSNDVSQVSSEIIFNFTANLINSSKDASRSQSLKTNTASSPSRMTSLRREGTFTKESSDVSVISVLSSKGSLDSVKTPTRAKLSLPAPGSTPYHSNGKSTRSSQRDKSCSMLNLTHSIEKSQSGGRRSSSLEVQPRATRVMFCSPLRPVLATQRKSKVIKSSIKGSNKSFVFDESPAKAISVRPVTRKRSFTQNDADEVRAKRKRLGGEELLNSINRLSRPRTQSAKQTIEPMTPTKCRTVTPIKCNSEVKVSSVRAKLPNFAMLHQRRFDKMESLDDCQLRKAQRARQLLTAPASLTKSRNSQNVSTVQAQEKPIVTKEDLRTKSKKPLLKAPKVSQPKTQITKKPSRLNSKIKLPEPVIFTATAAKAWAVNTDKEAMKPLQDLQTDATKPVGYTRFGFKLNLDVNPFSIPPKPNNTVKEKAPVCHLTKRNGIIPRKVNNTLTAHSAVATQRQEAAKQTVMREKSALSITQKKKTENRNIIKGVRTNRRFELQMQSRNNT